MLHVALQTLLPLSASNKFTPTPFSFAAAELHMLSLTWELLTTDEAIKWDELGNNTDL